MTFGHWCFRQFFVQGQLTSRLMLVFSLINTNVLLVRHTCSYVGLKHVVHVVLCLKFTWKPDTARVLLRNGSVLWRHSLNCVRWQSSLFLGDCSNSKCIWPLGLQATGYTLPYDRHWVTLNLQGLMMISPGYLLSIFFVAYILKCTFAGDSAGGLQRQKDGKSRYFSFWLTSVTTLMIVPPTGTKLVYSIDLQWSPVIITNTAITKFHLGLYSEVISKNRIFLCYL